MINTPQSTPLFSVCYKSILFQTICKYSELILSYLKHINKFLNKTIDFGANLINILLFH
jgi:hypothetical protein